MDDERSDGLAVDGEMSPEDAFGRVANETRFDILRALWAARNEGEEPTGFSALRRRSGVDDSGQFNYHLDQLRPHFVRSVDEGYELTYAGRRIIGAAVSGVYSDADVSVDAVDVTTCPSCEGTVRLSYEEAIASVACADCGLTVTNTSVPPVLVAGCDRSDLSQVVSDHLLGQVQRLNRGICPLCNGRSEREFVRPDDESGDGGDGAGEEESAFDEHVTVRYTCSECGASSSGVVMMAAFDHPTVVTFLDDHGIDHRTDPVWEFDWWYDATGRVVSDDPLRVTATAAIEGDELTLTFDESVTVLGVDHA